LEITRRSSRLLLVGTGTMLGPVRMMHVLGISRYFPPAAAAAAAAAAAGRLGACRELNVESVMLSSCTDTRDGKTRMRLSIFHSGCDLARHSRERVMDGVRR